MPVAISNERIRIPWGRTFLFLAFVGLLASWEPLQQALQQAGAGEYVAAIAILVRCGFWISAATLVSWTLNNVVLSVIARSRGYGAVPRLLNDIAAFFVYAIFVTIIVGRVFEQSLTGFWATSSVVGLVLGFAVRNIILDVFTGIAVNIDQPYRIGDWILVHRSSGDANVVGRVVEINWRTTRLHCEDGTTCIVPNSVISTSLVTNYWSPSPATRIERSVAIDFSVPAERARRVLAAALKSLRRENGFREHPAPQVVMAEIGDYGIRYVLRAWIDAWDDLSPSMAGDRLLRAVFDHLRHAGISPAYPKEDLYVASMPARQLDARSADGKRELLGGVELFRSLGADDLARLAAAATRRPLVAGEKVIESGARGESMFVLAEGLLHVRARGGDGVDEEVVVGDLQPGEFFGEMSLLTGEPRAATVVAETEAVVYEIGKEPIAEILERAPELANEMSRVVAERRLRTQHALTQTREAQPNEDVAGLARQILDRMRFFFAARTAARRQPDSEAARQRS